MKLSSMGQRGLLGWREKVADRAGALLSRHTPLDEEQARGLLGALFFLLALRYVVRTARGLAAEARSG
jgi:hypothetical protein